MKGEHILRLTVAQSPFIAGSAFLRLFRAPQQGGGGGGGSDGNGGYHGRPGAVAPAPQRPKPPASDHWSSSSLPQRLGVCRGRTADRSLFVITTLLDAAQAEAACRSQGYSLASLSRTNVKQAAKLLYQCAKKYRGKVVPGWIANSFQGKTYSCLELEPTSDSGSGTVSIPPSCSVRQMAVCGSN